MPDRVRTAVIETARELNYRPNRLARSMVTGRTHTIGVVPPGGGQNVFLSPYIQAALNGITNAAGRAHWDVLLVTRFEETQATELVDALVDGRIDGSLFLAPPVGNPVFEVLRERGLPCVALAGSPIPGVVTFNADNAAGIERALQHLVDLGHRKIAHVAGKLDMSDALVRLDAFRKFVSERGLPQQPQWVQAGDFVIDGGRDAMNRLLDLPDRPTAVICSNDEMAIGALRACQERGLTVPQHMSIVGFDMTPSSGVVVPAITTVRQPVSELADAAVRAVIALVDGEENLTGQVFRTELIVRASTTRPQEDLS